ncbi:hypothetical protein [Haloferula sargassicola]|uniref:hypothetical protein n=1 Tax=Haloferula sargassicola TaxID=490096 RepID=UPI0033659B18
MIAFVGEEKGDGAFDPHGVALASIADDFEVAAFGLGQFDSVDFGRHLAECTKPGKSTISKTPVCVILNFMDY